MSYKDTPVIPIRNSQVPGHSIVNLTKQIPTIMDVYHTTTRRITNQQEVSTELATTVKTVDNSNTAFTTLCTYCICLRTVLLCDGKVCPNGIEDSSSLSLLAF